MGNGHPVRVGALIRRDKFLARDFRHGCEHAFILDPARFQLLVHHPLALRCKICSCGDLLTTARRSDRGEKQIPRDDSHLPKDNAARAAAKGALRLLRDFAIAPP